MWAGHGFDVCTKAQSEPDVDQVQVSGSLLPLHRWLTRRRHCRNRTGPCYDAMRRLRVSTLLHVLLDHVLGTLKCGSPRNLRRETSNLTCNARPPFWVSAP